MTDQPVRSQTEIWSELYQAYLLARQSVALHGGFIDYDWIDLPDPRAGIWIIYASMLEDFARELANGINDLINHAHRLRAWDTVLEGRSQSEILEALHEFIYPIATTALGLPYVIKSRFAYAAAHLCHQANRTAEDWVDTFTDKRALYLNDVDAYGRPWGKPYRAFKTCVEAIGGRAFLAATGDFRNAYNHRVPRRLVLGEVNFLRREIDPRTERPVYVMGGEAPLALNDLAERLLGECDKARAAFTAFQGLVKTHMAAIELTEARSRT